MAQDQNPYAKYKNQGSEGENPYAKYSAPAPAPAPAAEPAPKSGIVRRLVGDTAVDLARGVIGVGEAAVGIGSLGTGGMLGKGMEAIGYDPKETKEIIGDYYSPERKLANQKVEQAQGFIGTTAEMLANPSTIAGAVTESVPLMLGGGAVARGLSAVPGLAGRAITRAAAGEGVVGAGSAAEGMRQESDDGLLNARQTAAAVGTGIGTGLIGAAGGAVARRLGIGDVDVAAAGGSTARAATDPAAPGLVRRTLHGAVAEGLLEEMPQSMQEQMWQNFGNEKDLMEGVPEAAAAGLLAGGAMGAGFAAASRGGQANAAPNDPQAQAKPEAPAPELLALPAPDGTPPSGVNIVTPGGTVLTPEQRGLDPRVMGEPAAPVPNPALSPEPRVWPDSMNQQMQPALPDGTPVPNPDNGPLSRAVNVGVNNGAVARTAALAQAAQAVEQAQASEQAKPAAARVDRSALPAQQPAAQEVQQPLFDSPAKVESLKRYLHDQAERNGTLPPSGVLAKATGIEPEQARAIVNEVRAERTAATATAEGATNADTGRSKPAGDGNAQGSAVGARRLSGEPVAAGQPAAPAAAEPAPATAAAAADRPATEPVAVAEEVSQAEYKATKERNRTAPAVDGDTWDTAKVLREKPVGGVVAIEGADPSAADGAARWTKLEGERWTDGKSTVDTNALARIFDGGETLDTTASKPAPAISAPAAEAPAAASDPHAGKWFGTQEKADAYLAKRGIAGTHQVVGSGRRFDIKPKAAPVEQKTADVSAAGAAAGAPATSPAAKTEVQSRRARKEPTVRVYNRDGSYYYAPASQSPSAPKVQQEEPKAKGNTYGLPRVVRKPDIIRALRQNAGMTVAQATEKYNAIPRVGLKEGTRSRENVIAAIEAEKRKAGGDMRAPRVADQPKVRDWLAKRLDHVRRYYNIPEGTDLQASLDNGINSENFSRFAKAKNIINAMTEIQGELAEIEDFASKNPERWAEAQSNDTPLDFNEPLTHVDGKPVTVRKAGGGAVAMVIDPSAASTNKATPTKSAEQDQPPTAGNEGNAQPTTPTAPDGWRGNLVKSRVYARGLIEAGSLDGDAARAAWGDADALATLIDGQQDELDAEMQSYEAKADKKAPAAGQRLESATAPEHVNTGGQFAGNKLFTDDKVEAARARMRAKLTQLNSGFDPELLIDGMTIAGAYIESGVRKFNDYAKAMVDDLGDSVKPYLLSFYEGVRSYPGLDTEGMDTVDDAARAHDRLLAPADLETPAIGERRPPAKKRATATTAAGERRLVDDYGVDHIDGYGPSAKPRETGSDVKDQFLKDTASYLRGVVSILEEAGYTATVGDKGKANKTVSVNESGPAGSGDVHLHMAAPSGVGIYATIGDTSLRGVVPTTSNGIALMYRTTDGTYRKSGANQWGRVDLTAAELAAELMSHVSKAETLTQRATEMPHNAPTEGANNVRRQDDQPGNRASSVPGNQREQPAQDRSDDPAAGVDQQQREEAARDERGGRAGGGAQTGVSAGAGRGQPDPAEQQSPDAGGVPAKRGATPDPVTPKVDLTITNELDFSGIGAVGKFNQNLAAIRLLKTLEAENRRATPAEQTTLAKYVGWGGLPQAFQHPTSGKVAKGWEARVAELADVMTPEELAAAGRSTQDAHYTAANVVTAMWDAVERIGFRGGRVLEPSMGTGNFFGLMPAQARSASQLTGVELDSITGRIAKQLYQNANVQVRGFNDIRIAPGSFDLAIGNPPFGSQSIHDPQYPDLSKASIHNYFFAKSIASVRPGGVLAMVVSSSFMDANTSATRAWIAERAQFLGAIRLPQTAFQANAGTNVTTDIVFLQRLPEGATSNANDWVRVGSMSDQGQSFPVNNYFVKNPDMMLGRMVWSTHTTIGRAGAVLEADKGADMSAMLAQAVAKLPQGVYQQQGKTFEQASEKASPAPQSVDVPVSAKVYGFFTAPDGSLRQRQPDLNGEQQSVAVELPDTSVARVKGMARIRDLARGMLRAELDERTTDAALDNARAELNKAYDQFVKDNGLLSRDVNKRLMRDDPDAPLLLSLERDYDAGVSPTVAKRLGVASRKESARKADIFTKRTNYPVKPVTSVSDAESAMLASLNERGRLDPQYMESIYPGKTIEDIEAELGDAVFREPNGNLVPADAYLSGNVKAKLAEARASNDPRMARNIAALEAVQPVDVEPTDIFVQVGSPWVPVEDYNAFAAETFGGQVKGRFSQPLGSWHVDITSNNQMLNYERWGHERLGAASIMELLMGNKPIAIYDKHQDGSRTLNTEDTAAAKGKATELQQEFGDWIWRDAGRRERLSRVFNDTYNTDVRRKFDGAHLTFPGMNRNILTGGNLRPHQGAFVYRVVQDGVALADHTVGAGKTYAAIASVMEMRRLGLWRKPMIVVPNHLVDQWATDFVRLYPGANVLAASRKDFSKGNRQRLFARIATGDWDAVIVAHSSFGFIPLPRETEQRILQQEVEEISAAMDEIRSTAGKKDLSFKQLQKRQEALQERIKRQAERPRDELMDFEEMGVDALTVDEAHEFKNLYFVTSQRNVAGLGSPEGSKKAFDLFVKMRYLAERGEGKNRVFLTGTPVSNTLSEVFHMQRYLQFEELQRRGIGMFDAWAGTFGQIVSDWEMDAANRFKEKSRFRKFANLPELVTMWRQVADTVTLADLRSDAEAQGQRFPVPKIKGGKRQNVTVPRSPEQAQFIGEPVPAMDSEGNPVVDPETGIPLEQYPEGSIIWRMDNMPKDPSIDNHLKATGDARKASLDYRLVEPGAPDFAGSKINRAVDNIVRAWRENAHRKGTQLVFCDLSVPASARGKATEAAQAAQPTWFVRHGDNIEHVPGVKLALSAMPDRKFFSHKTKRDGYRVYDANSGVYIASGKAKQDAVDEANAKLANDPATWSRRFEQGAIPGEQIEAYTQRWEDEKAAKDEAGGDDSAEQATQAISMDELLADESKHSVYDDMKAKLIAAGMPEREIAFIHDYNTDLQKADLFAKVNRGDIRVLFGSTAKMGAGMNVQKKLVALHHMDAPWRPSDLTQREGRILRQGNEFYEADPDGFEVELYAYGTEQTYDARQWEIIETKASGIETFQAGDASVREIDDISSEAANAADMKGAASGNPLILESIKLRKEVKDLESQERSHRRSVHAMESLIRSVDNRSAYAYRNLDAAEAQAKKFEGAEFNMKLGRVTFAEAKEVTSDAILAQFEDAVVQREPIRAGQFRGLDIVVEPRGGTLRVALYDGKDSIGNTEFGANDKVTPAGFVTRLENIFKRITTGLADAKAMVARTEREAAQAREEVGRGFPKAAELTAKRERQRKVVAALRAGRTEVEGDDHHLDYAITDLRRNGAGRPESAATRLLVDKAIADGDLAAMLRGIAQQEGVDADQAALATRLAGIVPNLSIKLVQEPANAPAGGLYNNIDGTMWIHQALPSVVIHETAHGVTSALLTNPTARQSIPGVAKAVAEFEDLLQAARDSAASLDMSKLSPALRNLLQDPRGALSNIKELLTYGTTDKLFQQWLARVPAPTGRDKARTGWQAFKDAVANLLGLRGRTRSALDALLESTDDLLSLAESNPRAVELVRKLEGTRQAGSRAAARDRSGFDPAMREWMAKHGAQDDARIAPFMELASRVAAAEKSSDPADWTEAERDAYARGDTAEFSRLRGYTKAEISEHQQYLQQADALIADYGVDFVAGLGQNPDGSFDFSRYVEAIDLAVKGPGKEGFERLKEMFKGLKPENLRENTRPAWLGALTMRHLAELGGDIKVGQVGDYADLVQRMATDRNIMQEDAGKTADVWEKFQRKDKAGADATANLMHDTTIKGIDPSKAYEPLQTGSTKRGKSEPVTDEAIERRIALVKRDLAKARSSKAREGFEAEMASLKALLEQERERRRLYPELVQRYQALPADGRRLYGEVRDAYERQSDRMLDALEARINSLELDGRVRAEMIGKVRQQFESAKLNGPYFPLQRFGDFWISAENSKGEPSFMLYERVQDWREAQRELKDQGYTIKAAGRKLDEARSVAGASGGFMADLQGLLSQAGVDEDTRDDVYQLYLRTLPELSVRKHQIHRKATKGYSNDALRAFSANLFHGSFQVARLRWSHEMEAALLAMKKQVSAMTSDDPERAAKAGALYTEMNKRHEWVMNPRDSKVVSSLTSLGFAWYLGTTPAAALVNLTQTAIVSFPVLAAKHGPVKAFNALTETMGRAARSVNGDITRGLSTEEVDAFKVWRESGTIDKSQAHSLAGLSDSDTRAFNPVAKRTMEIVSWLFHKAEVVNREATALAAFRLARASGQSFDEATRYASDVVTESHFDYSNANRARFMQSNAAKVLLLFRQYSLNMTWFLWRNLYQSIKAESPEVKREARIKLGGVLGMTGMFAGVMGMPLMSVMFGIANAAAAAFGGGGDDEPWDAEVAFRNFLADMLGADIARVLARGPVDAITGASFSSRVSLNDLWLREPNRDLEGQAQANYLLEQAAGPIFGGMLVNTLRGLNMVSEGHTMRGIETMMPKAIKDGMKALRYSTEGVNTMRGDPVIADLGVGGTLLQLAGFSPAELNERYDGINAAKKYETRIMDRRSSLLNAYAMAWRNSDADATGKVLEKIRAFNAANPAVAISASTIRQSMQSRLRYSSRAEGGVVLNPKLAAQAREQARFAE